MRTRTAAATPRASQKVSLGGPAFASWPLAGGLSAAKHPGKCPKCGGRLEFDTAVDEQIVCPRCQVSLSLPGKARLSDDVDPLLGQTLGQFEILDVIGRGGMGAVYKARQASLDCVVALDVLPRRFVELRGASYRIRHLQKPIHPKGHSPT